MYKRYVYEAEAMDRSEFGQHEVIKEVVMKKEQKKNFAAASESSILPFSGKAATRDLTVKTHAKLENADSCETHAYLDN